MKKLILFLPVFVYLNIIDLVAADTLAVHDAILKKRIAVTAMGNGGLGSGAARLVITNNISADLNILIPAGLMLNSEDLNAQDLIILEESVLFVQGRTTLGFDMFGACTQLSNYCPKTEEKYKLGQMAAKELTQIAQIISKNRLQLVVGQAAVWAFTDQQPIDNVFHPDYVDASWDMAKILAVYRKQNPPTREVIASMPIPPQRIVFSARADVVFHAPKNTKVQLAIYDSQGNMIKQQFPLKETFGGLHIYTIGVNNILDQNKDFYVRLTDQQGNILQEQLLSNNQAYTETKAKQLTVNFEYIVRQPSLISMSVYDKNDQLVQEIYKDQKQPLSKRNTNFKFIHAFPAGEELHVKMTNGDGEVIHVQKITTN